MKLVLYEDPDATLDDLREAVTKERPYDCVPSAGACRFVVSALTKPRLKHLRNARAVALPRARDAVRAKAVTPFNANGSRRRVTSHALFVDDARAPPRRARTAVLELPRGSRRRAPLYSPRGLTPSMPWPQPQMSSPAPSPQPAPDLRSPWPTGRSRGARPGRGPRLTEALR